MDPQTPNVPPAPWAFRVLAVTVAVSIIAALFFGFLIAALFAVAGVATAAAVGIDI